MPHDQHRLPPYVPGDILCRSLDADLRKLYPGGILPWERPVWVGAADWFKVHAYALDRIDELLARILPERTAAEDGTWWRGRHDAASPWIEVSLLSGKWSVPGARKRGFDLISLFAHIYRMPPRRAALAVAQWCEIEAVRHG
jgi:hypothetical protein